MIKGILPKKDKTKSTEGEFKRPSLLHLFLYFLKVGATTFGGGYAIIGLLQAELVEKKKWVTEKEMIDMMAIGESTPGAFAINMATFLGYKLRGFWGSLLCTLAFVLPSFAIISLISYFIDAFLQNQILAWAFQGIRAGVIMMIGRAFIKFFKGMPKSSFSIIVFVATSVVALFTNISIIVVILCGALLGLILTCVHQRKLNKKEAQDKEGGEK